MSEIEICNVHIISSTRYLFLVVLRFRRFTFPRVTVAFLEEAEFAIAFDDSLLILLGTTA